MDAEPLHYYSGEEIHAGDRISHNGDYGRVVFVSNGENEEFTAGFEDYIGSDRGVMICDDDGATQFLGEPAPDLSFLDRG